MIDELQLFRGKDYVINDFIIIRQPTLDEICDYGEKKYYSMVSAICATPSEYKVQLHDLGVDYEDVSEFEFFAMLSNSLTPKDTAILFGDLDFSAFNMMHNVDTDENILCDLSNNIVIDNAIYMMITNYLRTIHGFKKRVDKAGNAHTKKYLIERERRRQARLKNKPFKSMLVPLISAMTNCEQFKYNHDTVWDLHIYTFNDCVKRISKIKNYNYIMQGYYAGNVDLSKVSSDSLNWLGDLS